jgi:hypothetical protein
MDDVLDRAAVAELVGVEPDTITSYLHMSQPGRLYADHPFPAPDGRFGKSPYWRAGRSDEIRSWVKGRPRGGVSSGGRPRKVS